MLFEDVRHDLDLRSNFGDISGSDWHHDAVYPDFSTGEYDRRYSASREKMRALEVDALVIGGGPSHWVSGGGVLWLTGHWEWHAMACYLVLPLESDPVLVYSMGGTHLESVRMKSRVADVRPSRGGRFAEVMADVLREKGRETGRIGHPPIDPRFGDYMPANQLRTLETSLPQAEIVLLDEFFHDLMVIKSDEELECIRRAGQLCTDAFEAIVDRARPGVTERQLAAAAGSAILHGGGHVDFVILAATSTFDPHLVFGSPAPSDRPLAPGDMIVHELAAGYRGYTAQIGMPIFVGDPEPSVAEFFETVTVPGFVQMEKTLGPGVALRDIHEAGRFFRSKGHQSRPIHLHGIDLVTAEPHVWADASPQGELQAGQVVVLEPNPIRADGRLGMFFGHTYIIDAGGWERVTTFRPDMVKVV